MQEYYLPDVSLPVKTLQCRSPAIPLHPLPYLMVPGATTQTMCFGISCDNSEADPLLLKVDVLEPGRLDGCLVGTWGK